MDDKQRERLAELRAQDIEREAKKQEEADLRELEARELVLNLEDKGLKRDIDFKIVSNPIGGVYALRKPDTRAIRNWEQASDKQKLSLEWQIGLIKHYIVDPDEKDPTAQDKRGIAWAQMCGARPGLCWQTVNAFGELMGMDIEGTQRK